MKKRLSSALPFVALCAFALPALAQTDKTASSMEDVLAGRVQPLNITGKDLNPNYRRMVIGASSEMANWQSMMMGAKAGVELGLYYSTGQTISSGGETYLLAYRPQIPIDPMIFQNHGHGNDDGKPPSPQKLRAVTPLALSLLNLRTTSSFNDIRPFDEKRDMESPAESTAASVRNLQNLGRGVLTYLNGRGRRVLPEIGAVVTPQLKRTFYPFVHDQQLWNHPLTGDLYQSNPAVSRLKVNEVTNKKYLPLFYEPTASMDGMRGVLFLDGHVERVTAERWERLQKVKPMGRGNAKLQASATSGDFAVSVIDEE